MIFNKPLLIVFGGNNGQQACMTNHVRADKANTWLQAESDIWVLDVERSPFQWQEASAHDGIRRIVKGFNLENEVDFQQEFGQHVTNEIRCKSWGSVCRYPASTTRPRQESTSRHAVPQYSLSTFVCCAYI